MDSVRPSVVLDVVADMLRQRLEFTQRLQGMHSRTLAKHSDLKTPELDEKAHELWSENQAKQAKRQRAEGPRMPCPLCQSAGY